jgi:3-hydroxy-9,10-secoandrosta-1,3,5(10)-triene-9,17-dione monooxygenase
MKAQPPSSEELVARAEALIPLLRRNALEAEYLRRLPDETIEALHDAGLLRIARPAHRGGYASDPATIARVTTAIASGCPATAWVAMIYNTVVHLAELLPEQAMEEVYAEPDPRIAAVFGRTGALLDEVEGGWRVRGQGRWPFNSGCHHAQWDLLRVELARADGTIEPAFVIIPFADLTIADDWHVMGACGTGSSTVTCGEIFVPAHRVAPLFSVPVREAVPAALVMAQNVALPLGMTRYAIEAFLDMAKNHGISHLGYERMLDAPQVQVAVSKAQVNAKMLEAFQHYMLSGVDSGDPRLLLTAATACFRLAREAIEALWEAAPSPVIGLNYPLQRLMRDALAFEHQQAFSSFIHHELYGREAVKN